MAKRNQTTTETTETATAATPAAAEVGTGEAPAVAKRRGGRAGVTRVAAQAAAATEAAATTQTADGQEPPPPMVQAALDKLNAGEAAPAPAAAPDAPPAAEEALPQVFLNVLSTGTIDARELTIDESRNVRRFPHTPAAIQERAADMLANGQLQPIVVSRNGGGGLTVEWGFLRALAGKHINEHGLTPEAWMLRYEEVDAMDVLTHLCRGARENIARKEMNDIDLLALFKRLQAAGLDQRRIGIRLQINEGIVSRVFGLQKLDAREQRFVAQGVVKAEQARELAAMPKEARKPLVDRIAAGERVPVSEIKQAAATAKREAAAAEEDGGKGKGKGKKAAAGASDPEPAPDGGRALSAKQIAFPFEAIAKRAAEAEAEGGKSVEMDAVEKWCARFVEYRMGNGSARKLARELYRLAQLDPPSWLKNIPE